MKVAGRPGPPNSLFLLKITALIDLTYQSTDLGCDSRTRRVHRSNCAETGEFEKFGGFCPANDGA